MKIDIQFDNETISNEQAETFAYNIYKDIAEYMKENFDKFIWWNLETLSINCVVTLSGIICRKYEHNYNLCNYEKDENK